MIYEIRSNLLIVTIGFSLCAVSFYFSSGFICLIVDDINFSF